MHDPHPPLPRRIALLLTLLGVALLTMFSLASARPPEPADDAPAAAPASPQIPPPIAIFLATYPEFGRPAALLPPPDPSAPSLHALRTDRGRLLHFRLADQAVSEVSEVDPATGIASPLRPDPAR